MLLSTSGPIFCLLLLLLSCYKCEAFSESHLKTVNLLSVTDRRTGVLDGAELAALSSFLSEEQQQGSDAKTLQVRSEEEHHDAGVLNFATGILLVDGVNRRIIGIESQTAGGGILQSSMALIPNKVSDADAISTAMAAIVGVHCCVPMVAKVGGSTFSDGSNFVTGKAVILGGGAYARFCADALEKLGADVTLVTTGNPQLKNKRVNVIAPAVGDSEIGFAAALGQFDTVLDTLYDETNVGEGRRQMGSGVVEELKRLHNCKRYVSTFANAQKIIRDAGVLWGPNKAAAYQREVKSSILPRRSSKYQDVPVPDGFGQSTLQTLLDEGIIFSDSKKTNGPIFRGWTLEDFWEFVSWPRDSSGSVNSRFGLPVIDDVENIRNEEEEKNFQEEKESPAETISKIPFVKDIHGIDSLQNNIVSTKLDCVLFLSAPFCRTCKVITPQYARMARLAEEEYEGTITFAKADAMGKAGKDLGRSLQVETVPTFIIFRRGERFGSPISVSKLPSKELDLAVYYLRSGMEWDVTAFRDV